ncbi:group II truncated hemoglobin [Halopseudomonas salegens]|uniref:Hemoglobin n=1 Tax=Halopseudomonas salegens TaxID=1434072 RepID=A0A1H2I3N1_9GAMM|nr:group II truncated hemoglobin [Halopseudomonas salegens]SDU38506.1 hemoglobin [Halopseudomonas salegens]
MTDKPGYGEADASYQAAGGIEGIRRLVDDFYQVMDTWPDAERIRRMHPADLSPARDKLSCFLSGWLGGPRLFQETYGSISIPAFHARWPIDTADAEAWLGCMQQAIARQPWSPAFKDYLLRQLAVPAQRVVQAAQARQAAQQ